MTFELKIFNMNMIKDHQNILVIGLRNTGKSFLTKDILYHQRDIPIGTIVSPTENINRFYKDFVPSVFIQNEYSPDMIKNFMKRQKSLIKRIHKGENIDNRAFLVLEDCIYDKNWYKDNNIKNIYMNSRNWGIFFILTTQHLLDIPPMLRACIDFVFIFKNNIESQRKRIYKQYAMMIPTFEMFCTILDSIQDDHTCLVINNCSPSPKIEDQIFLYKAENHDDLKLCIPEAWEFSEKINNENENESIDKNKE